jgi:hypothetical protein
MVPCWILTKMVPFLALQLLLGWGGDTVVFYYYDPAAVGAMIRNWIRKKQ